MTATFSSAISLPTPPIKQAKLYINGQWRSASDGKTRPTISPISETAIAVIPQASEQDVEDAILAARRAFDDSSWAKMTGHDRQQILTRVSEGNPLDPDVLFGPLADAGQLQKVMQYVEYGKQDGATLRYGGERFYPDGTDGKGYYFQPSVEDKTM